MNITVPVLVCSTHKRMKVSSVRWADINGYVLKEAMDRGIAQESCCDTCKEDIERAVKWSR